MPYGFAGTYQTAFEDAALNRRGRNIINRSAKKIRQGQNRENQRYRDYTKRVREGAFADRDAYRRELMEEETGATFDTNTGRMRFDSDPAGLKSFIRENPRTFGEITGLSILEPYIKSAAPIALAGAMGGPQNIRAATDITNRTVNRPLMEFVLENAPVGEEAREAVRQDFTAPATATTFIDPLLTGATFGTGGSVVVAPAAVRAASAVGVAGRAAARGARAAGRGAEEFGRQASRTGIMPGSGFNIGEILEAAKQQPTVTRYTRGLDKPFIERFEEVPFREFVEAKGYNYEPEFDPETSGLLSSIIGFERASDPEVRKLPGLDFVTKFAGSPMVWRQGETPTYEGVLQHLNDTAMGGVNRVNKTLVDRHGAVETDNMFRAFGIDTNPKMIEENLLDPVEDAAFIQRSLDAVTSDWLGAKRKVTVMSRRTGEALRRGEKPPVRQEGTYTNVGLQADHFESPTDAITEYLDHLYFDVYAGKKIPKSVQLEAQALWKAVHDPRQLTLMNQPSNLYKGGLPDAVIAAGGDVVAQRALGQGLLGIAEESSTYRQQRVPMMEEFWGKPIFKNFLDWKNSEDAINRGIDRRNKRLTNEILNLGYGE